MSSSSIPDIVVGRLPIYLRALNFLDSEGRVVTSSQELGDRLGFSAAQIRKDLAHFGEFGKQGAGYNIVFLREQIQRILKLNQIWPVVLVGAGDLGHALANYDGFEGRGFHIAAVFDNDRDKIGRPLGSLVVNDIALLSEKIRALQIQIGVIATPANVAQNIANTLVSAGVKAILNYAPISLSMPKGIRVQQIDPVTHLQRMTFYLTPPTE